MRRLSQQTTTLVVVSAGLFMLLLDLTVVYVALPSVKRSLHASLAELQLVVDVYAMALAATLLASGALADIVGRRKVFCLGLALFSLASLACGLAQNPPELIAGRAVQGVGGAMIFATSFAIVGVTFEGHARAKAFGVIGAVAAVAGALGPLVGGMLTETLGWPTIFVANLPLGVGALALALRGVPETRRPDPPPVDWGGTVLLCALLALLVLALLRGNDLGWSSAPILSLFAGGVACLVAFVLVERRRSEPLLDLRLLRRPTFVGVSLVAFTQAASLFALLLYVSIYLQGVLGYSPLESGLCLLPIPLSAMPPGLAAAWLAARIPARALLTAGLLLIAAGVALLAQVEATGTWIQMLPACVLAGTGLGLLNPPLAAAAVDVVPRGRAGVGSGINATFRQVGIALAIAAYGAIFEHRVVSDVTERLRGTSLQLYAGRIADAVVAGGNGETLADAPAGLRPHIRDVALHAFLGGLHAIVLIAAVVAAVSAVATAALVRKRDLGPAGPHHAHARGEHAPAGEPAYSEA
ncbi:MAG: MFS transporter [Actinobacteria bacterium]|nr:MFS transporter [Actinomycetota bacterium]